MRKRCTTSWINYKTNWWGQNQGGTALRRSQSWKIKLLRNEMRLLSRSLHWSRRRSMSICCRYRKLISSIWRRRKKLSLKRSQCSINPHSNYSCTSNKCNRCRISKSPKIQVASSTLTLSIKNRLKCIPLAPISVRKTSKVRIQN